MEGSVAIEGVDIPRVEDFKYLGSTIQEDGGSDKEVSKRIQAGWNGWRKITGIMCDKKPPEKLKGQLYKTMVRPAMTYGLETVALTKSQESKFEVAEMRMLRFSLGLTLHDKVRNEEVRKRVGVGELGQKLREDRLRWFGHVYRRDEDYVGKRVQKIKVGKRKRGRPKRRWEDCIREDMKVLGLREEDANDRTSWRKKITTGDPKDWDKSL